MRIFFILVYISFLISTANATHIVGGEIEVKLQRGNTYTLLVKMYVDEIGGAAVVNLENSANVGIYEKITNRKMDEFTLAKVYHRPITYESVCNPSQAQAIKTGLILFQRTVTLNPAKYSSNNGYYIVYENCCRNGAIKNIIGPKDEGMAFYTEFPPLSTNNNSPTFKVLKGDYPCLNRPFTFDFSGEDPDGDSLAYSLSTPLAGHLTVYSTQTSYPAPYDSVRWQSGYNRLNQIRGNPPLRVNSKTGQLSVVASELGLFVFSVNVYEFRNGVLIGMVKRDFQLPVITCPDNAPPSLDLKLPDGTIYSSIKDTLVLQADKDSCFSIIASDSNTIKFNQSENLSFNVLSANIPTSIFRLNSTTVSPGRDTSTVSFCVSPCDKVFIKKDSVVAVTIVVSDGPKCPPSLVDTDTLQLVLKFTPPKNQKPTIGILPEKNYYTVVPNKSVSFTVYATDPDKGTLVSIKGEGQGFNLHEKNISFSDKSAIDSVASLLTWTPSCEQLEDGIYKIRFITNDNSCLSINKDTIEVTIAVVDTTTIINQIQLVNLITPNEDGTNEYFEIRDIPRGNCDYYFKAITIFNRWGAKVYESTNDKFKWNAENEPDGLYFYQVDLNKKAIKGWLQITR